MNDVFTARNELQRTIRNTDQVELTAVTRGSAVSDAGIFDELLAEALDDFEPLPAPGLEMPWQRRDLEIETAVSAIGKEIAQRRRLLGPLYPFELKQTEIVYQPSASGFYEFCLAISQAPNISVKPYVKMGRLFERMCGVLIANYLGSFAGYVHTGAPRDQSVGTRFSDAMMTVQKLTGEWIWDPEPGLPGVNSRTGDEGIDLVIWKGSLDDRPGKLFLLVQCACGDDWLRKFTDLDLSRISKWFHPLSYVSPVRAFAIPHHIADGNLLCALKEAGMVFDRVRLTRLAHEFCGNALYSAHKDRLQSLTKLVMTSAFDEDLQEAA